MGRVEGSSASESSFVYKYSYIAVIRLKIGLKQHNRLHCTPQETVETIKGSNLDLWSLYNDVVYLLILSIIMIRIIYY